MIYLIWRSYLAFVCLILKIFSKVYFKVGIYRVRKTYSREWYKAYTDVETKELLSVCQGTKHIIQPLEFSDKQKEGSLKHFSVMGYCVSIHEWYINYNTVYIHAAGNYYCLKSHSLYLFNLWERQHDVWLRSVDLE